MTYAAVQQGDSGVGSITSGVACTPASPWTNVQPGDLIVVFVTTLDNSAVSAISGFGATWTIGTQVTGSGGGSIQECSCVAVSATASITVTTAGGGKYILQVSEWPAGTTIASVTSANGTSATPAATVAASAGQQVLVAVNSANAPTAHPLDPWAVYDSGGWSDANFNLELAEQLVGGLQPLIIPAGSGLLTPHNYQTLVQDYDFTTGSLPADWHVVLDDVNNYAPSKVEYTSSQVTFSGSGVNLLLSTDTGSFNYKGGLIGTISGGTASTIGTPTRQFQHGRFRFFAQMPSPALTGIWPACWMVSLIASVTDASELDVVEMNQEFPNTAWGTLHQWKPTPIWQEGGYSGPVAGTTYDNILGTPGAEFHCYELVWEPGMVTFAVDGVASGQITQAQAVADGHVWDIDLSQCYLLADCAVSFNGTNAFGSDFSATNNASLPVAMTLATVQVYQ